MKVEFKELSAAFMLVVGSALAIIALLLPPKGVIDSSVIYIFAQTMIYAGTVFGFVSYADQLRKDITKNEDNR